MKHLYRFALAALFAFASTLTAVASDFEVDGICYNILSKEDLTCEVSWGKNYSGEVVIPSSVSYSDNTYSVISIGQCAFGCCEQLTSVTIPNSVASIGKCAFEGCYGLTGIIVVSENQNFSSLDGVLFNKDLSILIAYPAGKSNEYTIPNSVTSIGCYAFSDCNRLTSVTIPNSVTSIGYSAFLICTGLTSVTIPNSVTSIGGRAFSFCSGLTSIVIPNSVTSIEDETFYGCSGLTSVTILNGVTSIGYGAFKGCSGLASVTIPNSVTSIEESAFKSCYGLTSVIIPGSVTIIGYGAFYDCTSLKEVISLNPTPPTIEKYTFGDNTVKDCSLYVPESAITAYQTAYRWQDFSTIKAYEPSSISTATYETDADDAKAYTIFGTIAPDGYKGIVVKNGKKILKK